MSGVLDRVRTDRRVAIGLVLAILFLIAWIAWAVYVWNENGSAAGIGVLVSWPAVLAVVASPFVAVAWFRRNREEGAETESDDGDELGDEGAEDIDDEGSGDEGPEGDEESADEGSGDDGDRADEATGAPGTGAPRTG